MKIGRSHIIGITFALILILISAVLLYLEVAFFDANAFYFMLAISLVVAGLPFFMSLVIEARIEKNKEQMFLEFSRDLVEGVRAGTPISKSIINVKNKDYGSLNPYINKLINQISLGIPVKDAFEVFAKDIGSPVISRAVSLIREAERSGGKIEAVLESVTFSVGQIEKLKKERQAAIYSLTIQGYIIFLIFIAIMLIMQFKILPITSELNTGFEGGAELKDVSLGVGGAGLGGMKIDPEEIARSFLFLLITQGFFAGLDIGKITEGMVMAGLKHSFILVAIAIIISTGAKAFLS